MHPIHQSQIIKSRQTDLASVVLF